MKSFKVLLAAALLFAPISAFSYELSNDALDPASHLCPEFAHTLAKAEAAVNKAAGVTAKGDQSTDGT